jgi:ribose 5-phosphate isomerase
MNTQQPILTTTVITTAALTARRFVGIGTGATCAAGVKALGVAEYDADAATPAPVNVLGILEVEAGAAVAVGASVESDATGRAITLAAGVANGIALDAATAAGDSIRIVRGI